METEAMTIQFVKTNAPSVPVPEILEHYIDEKALLSHVLERCVPGKPLNEVWQNLEKKVQNRIANQIATHINTLARVKSVRLGGATGKMLQEAYLIPRSESTSSTEQYVPHFIDPDASDKYHAIWGTGKDQNQPVFYHGDLGPTNIIVDVTEDVTGILQWEVVAILDWAEAAGFMPRGWVATKTSVSRGYQLDEGANEPGAWRKQLTKALEAKGFRCFKDEWSDWWRR